MVEYTPYRGVNLSEAGEKIALEIIRHHRLLELYLAEALGYSWDEVDAEAEKLEHVISEEFEDRIDEILGFPTIDPHGAPIPSRKGDIYHRTSLPLSQLQAGQSAIVQEVSDQNPELLRYVEDLGLKLGTRMQVQERAPFNGPFTEGRCGKAVFHGTGGGQSDFCGHSRVALLGIRQYRQKVEQGLCLWRFMIPGGRFYFPPPP